MSLFRFVLTSSSDTTFVVKCDGKVIVSGYSRNDALTLVNASHIRDMCVIRWHVSDSGVVYVYV